MNHGAAPERSGLWRERPFQLLWVGQTAAHVGSQVRLVVLPVLMFQRTGSAAQTALVFTIAGVLTDRIGVSTALIVMTLGVVAGQGPDTAVGRTVRSLAR